MILQNASINLTETLPKPIPFLFSSFSDYSLIHQHEKKHAIGILHIKISACLMLVLFIAVKNLRAFDYSRFQVCYEYTRRLQILSHLATFLKKTALNASQSLCKIEPKS